MRLTSYAGVRDIYVANSTRCWRPLLVISVCSLGLETLSTSRDTLHFSRHSPLLEALSTSRDTLHFSRHSPLLKTLSTSRDTLHFARHSHPLPPRGPRRWASLWAPAPLMSSYNHQVGPARSRPADFPWLIGSALVHGAAPLALATSSELWNLPRPYPVLSWEKKSRIIVGIVSRQVSNVWRDNTISG